MNKNLQRLAVPGGRLYLIFLVLFAAAALFFKMYELAVAEGVIILILMIYSFFSRRRRAKQLESYIESVTYETENAKNNTLMNFPLPIAVFRLADSRIIWGNEMFFDMCGEHGTRMDASVADMIPEFNGKWLLEGKNQYPTLLELGGRKYQLHGNIIRSEKGDDKNAFMGITYWVDVTDYDNIRQEYERTRPVAGIVIDNFEEMCRNQTDRVKNDIRDAIEDKLKEWCDTFNGILRRYDRDRYLLIMEPQDLEHLRQDKFRITEDIHQVESPTGIGASISIGLGMDGESRRGPAVCGYGHRAGPEPGRRPDGHQKPHELRVLRRPGQRGRKAHQGQVPRHGQHPRRARAGFLQGTGHGPSICRSG
ncbi:MAG: hypothetical protein V8S72_03495 [Oscillospiraceae bacterium]